mmetsp:Transcript_16350/g.15663  ORF Transcript_16350/g.15663 Transcript_16350/m.15663 type:complete len:457 (-) Transcript_16350:45-1415(-)
MLGTEGLWALIASTVKGPEVEEIAHIVGNKRIKDNQVLWEEVKAYTNIISEMHMLEFGGDEESGSPESPTNGLNSNYIKNSSSDDHNSSKTKFTNSNGVPLLALKKNASSSSSGSSIKPSTMSSNEINFRPSSNSRRLKDDHINKEGSDKRKNNNDSSPNSININSDRFKGNQEDETLDSVDFILSIKDFLTTDRVAIVVEKIRAALDQEKSELNLKMKELEGSMEMDCEVIVTNRSSNRSNKSTPRTDEFVVQSKGSGNLNSYDKNSNYKNEICSKNETYYSKNETHCSNSKALVRGSEIGSISNRSNGDRFDVCVICGVDVDIYETTTERSKESDTARSKGSSDWNDYMTDDHRSSVSPEVFCCDCKGRNRREKILGGRLPKVESSSRDRVSSYMDDKQEKNDEKEQEELPSSTGGKQQLNQTLDKYKQPSSKFKNRIQAARDEHHFREDDYLS